MASSSSSSSSVNVDDLETPGERAQYLLKEWSVFLESAVRLSVAGAGGMVAGYGVASRMPANYADLSSNINTNQAQPRTSLQNQSGRPPTLSGAASLQRYKIARGWGLSCFLFVAVLETARLSSPMTALRQVWLARQERQAAEQQQKVEDGNETAKNETTTTTTIQHNNNTNHNREPILTQIQRQAWISMGDHALGGCLAGLAGARAWARNSIVRAAPAVLGGVGAGTALGFVLGACQAAVDGLELYHKAREEKEEDWRENYNSSNDNGSRRTDKEEA